MSRVKALQIRRARDAARRLDDHGERIPQNLEEELDASFSSTTLAIAGLHNGRAEGGRDAANIEWVKVDQEEDVFFERARALSLPLCQALHDRDMSRDDSSEPEEEDEDTHSEEQVPQFQRQPSLPPLALSSHRRFAHLYDEPIEKPEVPLEYRTIKQEDLSNEEWDHEPLQTLEVSRAGRVWEWVGGLLKRVTGSDAMEVEEEQDGEEDEVDESQTDGDEEDPAEEISNASTSTSASEAELFTNSLYPSRATSVNPPSPPRPVLIARPSVAQIVQSRNSLLPTPSLRVSPRTTRMRTRAN